MNRPGETTFKTKLILYLIGAGVLTYAAMLCGAAYTEDCSLSEWFGNFRVFILEEHHFIVGFTKITPFIIFIFLSIWTLGFLYYWTKYEHPFAGREYGDAKWGDVKKFTKIFANHDDHNIVEINFGDAKAPRRPFVVNTKNYWLAEGCYLNIDNKLTSNLNILVVGPPGTGKSFRFARPILSQLCGSFLVTDPKGELYKQSGQFFEDNGYEVFVLNLESEEAMSNSTRFNPFDYLDNESSILSIADILFRATKDPDSKSSSDPFFENSAKQLLICILFLMHITYPAKDKNWTKFVELLDSTGVVADENGGIDVSDENCLYQRFVRANDNWKKGLYTDGVEQDTDIKGFVDVKKYYTGAHETTSGIVSSLDQHCVYMKLECVKRLLSKDEIDIKNSFGYCKKTKKCPTGKRILYIVTSESKRYFDWITSIIYELFFDELYHVTTIDKSLDEHLPEHLTFLMDEFANITISDKIVYYVSTMRSRGMSVVAIIQTLKQLKEKFPDNDKDKNFRGSFSIISVLGGPDMDSCKELEEEFGKTTIRKQTTGLTNGTQGSSSENEDVMEMPLFRAYDISQMDKDGPLALKVKGTDPLWVKKCRFERSPLLPLLTRKEPYKIKKPLEEEITYYDKDKADAEQIPELLFGAEAEAFLAKCENEGVDVIKIEEEDLYALDLLERNNKTLIGNDATTKAFWQSVREQSERTLKEVEQNELDFDRYSDKEFLIVQKLKNSGFSTRQIKCLDEIICSGFDFEEILMYFNPGMNIDEISMFASRLVKINKAI